MAVQFKICNLQFSICNAVRRRNGNPHPALRFAPCPPSPPRGGGFADGILLSVHVYEMERTVRIHRDLLNAKTYSFRYPAFGTAARWKLLRRDAAACCAAGD